MTTTCKNCLLQPRECICEAVDKFFANAPQTQSTVALFVGLKTKDKVTTCIACYFKPCRCKKAIQEVTCGRR